MKNYFIFLISFISIIPFGGILSYESPIFVSFDLHADPISQNLPLDQKYEYYIMLRENLKWVLDLSKQKGFKITFLSSGEFMEFILDDEESAIPLMMQVYENGGSIGTHSHSEYYAGPHNWQSFGNNANEKQSKISWNDAINFVNSVIRKVINSNNSNDIFKINNIRGAHIP